jgi:hypothetical protein
MNCALRRSSVGIVAFASFWASWLAVLTTRPWSALCLSRSSFNIVLVLISDPDFEEMFELDDVLDDVFDDVLELDDVFDDVLELDDVFDDVHVLFFVIGRSG